MYAVSVDRTFVARHYLTVPDAGPEGSLHAHRYGVEATVEGPELGEHGYLVDVDDLGSAVDAVVDRFRDRTLNELPAFEGLNPSAEHFARVFGDRLVGRLDTERPTSLEISMTEDDTARVHHERRL